MSDLLFYFDPLCPFTWRASRWIREVQAQQPLEVEWKFFSLALNNGGGDDTVGPLRALALARREGGNEAVNNVYKALGGLTHDKGLKPWEGNVLEEAFPEALSQAGLSPDLYARAQQDPATLADVKNEFEEAKTRYKAYGSPWLVRTGQDFGFNGPIMSLSDEGPTGQNALDLWTHFSWLINQPYLYEVKRTR